MADWDIHDGAGKLKCIQNAIKKADFASSNKKLIFEFDDACVIEGLSIHRRAKLLWHLKIIASDLIPIPFKKTTKIDLRKAVSIIESHKRYSLWTKRDYKLIIRKFFKWYVFKEDAFSRHDFPEIVSWIRTTIKKKDRCRVRASDLILPDEVERLIQGAKTLRNKALIALTYELGARIGELGTLRVRDISRDEYSFVVDLDGKTGERAVRVVLYANHVASWLNNHPAKQNPDSPLWPSLQGKTYLKHLPYRELSSIFKKAANQADIKKRVYPHIFRHSRATHVLATGQFNEAQAKVFFGWTPDSSILSTYVHLVSKDANDAVLKMYGIQNNDNSNKINATNCGMCKTPNPTSASFCFKCGYSLNIHSVEKVLVRKDNAENLLNSFLKKPEVRALFKKMVQNELHSEGSEPLQ